MPAIQQPVQRPPGASKNGESRMEIQLMENIQKYVSVRGFLPLMYNILRTELIEKSSDLSRISDLLKSLFR